ncbi:linker histone H1 and H5 family protein, partial [Wuchereria bancrofti]
MIKEAIVALKDRKGSSRLAILKYISGHYQLGDNGKRVHSQLRLAIKKGIASGKLTLAKGAGVNGCGLTNDDMEATAIELPSPPRISDPIGKSSKKQSGVQGTSKARSKRQGAKVTKNHPTYSQMIKEAIVALKDRKGSSRLAILKYISGHYQLGDNGKRVHSQLRLAIKKGIASGKLTLAK